MNSQILTDFEYINNSEIYNIEKLLVNKYGDVLRWAIVDANNEELKITVTYKK